MFTLLFFIFGLCIGSFINVIVYRLREEKSFIYGRSFCPKCKKIIAWFDNIPLFGFLNLRGKCRNCHQKISWEYPLVELAAGLLFVLIFWRFGFSPKMFFALVSCSFLLVIFIYDLKYFQILDVISLPAIATCLILNLAIDFDIYNYLIAAAIGAGFFAFQYFISRGKWVGDGDIRLGALMGVILGWKYLLVALFLAYVVGAIVGVTLMLASKKKMSSALPFGPFLTFATFISLLFGQEILSWYLGLLM